MSVCPHCGATLQADALPDGLCPQCLLQLGLLSDTEEPTVGSGLARDELEVVPGEQFGPYKTIRVLGEGGMGIVYLAEQRQPIRRRVALKVIKLGMNSREVMARFSSERQALALMDHPNIAHVLDAGISEQGQPYFAMEYVNGAHITDYCDSHRLSNRERMELFTQVCQAVQHAHQKGVIHRDIKPSNVLVSERDGKPFPQVIDFGVAKATDQRLAEYSAFTQFGQLVGTPEYMSPEQAELGGSNVDTSTDVYSLGVLLYQLLVGVLPFEGARLREAGLLEVLRVIREEEPPTPSNRLAGLKEVREIAATRRTDPAAMRRQLAGDLSWVVLKAIEKEKERRYASALDLAGDVRRYLADRPVVARPPSAIYQMRKFARRHRAQLGSVAAVLVLLVCGIVVARWQAVRASRAEAIARSEADRSAVLERIITGLRQGTTALGGPGRLGGGPLLELLTFESQRGPGFPQGWFGGPPLTIFADNNIVHGGRWAARIERRLDSPDTFSDLGYRIPVKFSGTQVELRGFLRTEDVTTFAGLWMREDSSSGEAVAFDNMESVRLHATTDWTEYSVKLPIKSDAQWLVFGFLMVGSGRAWADDLDLLVDGKSIRYFHKSSNIWRLALDPTGRALGDPVPITAGYSMNIQPAVSRDGNRLAFASDEPGLQLMDLSTGDLVHLASDIGMVNLLVFGGGGDKIYCIGSSLDGKTKSDYEVAIESGKFRKIFRESLGGIWDSSPNGDWLLRSSFYKSPENTPDRQSISAVDSRTLKTIPLVGDSSSDQYQAHFSRDGRWLTFNSRLKDLRHSRIYVVPFTEHPVQVRSWIPITDGSTWDDKPYFSSDDKLIFFTSEKDGHTCIWAQPLTPDMRPAGPTFAVYHFHSGKLSLGWYVGELELAVGRQALFFNQVQYSTEPSPANHN